MTANISINRQGRAQATAPALRALWRQAAERTLAALNRQEAAEISLLLTDDDHIRLLNRDYRGRDAATDVLSFAMEEGEGFLPAQGEPRLLGDIVISRERAAEQAAAIGHSQEREEVFLFIHGLLHLLGYDHERSHEEEQEMFALQERIINEMWPAESKSAK